MRSIALALLAATACSSHHDPKTLSGPEAEQLLTNRNWIDHWPQTKTDKLHVYRFVPNMGGGVFQDRTVFKGTFELFKFEQTETEIKFLMPETGQRTTSRYWIEPVDGPHPFDLKLTIQGDPRGPHTYFGIRAETDPDGHMLEQELQPLAASH